MNGNGRKSPPELWRQIWRRKSDVAHLILRLLCLLSSGAAVSFMVTAQESATLTIYGFNIPFYSKWSFSYTFRFLVGISAAVASYSFLQLLLAVWKLARRSPVITNQNYGWILFAVDQIFSYAMMSGGSAAAGVTNLNRTGIQHPPLPNFCKTLRTFCHHAGLSISCAFFTCFFLAASALLDVLTLPKST